MWALLFCSVAMTTFVRGVDPIVRLIRGDQEEQRRLLLLENPASGLAGILQGPVAGGLHALLVTFPMGICVANPSDNGDAE